MSILLARAQLFAAIEGGSVSWNEEIIKLIAKVERSGYTIVPLDLHFSKGRVKVEIGLAKGKKQHDKRDTEKERDWDREKGRIMRAHNK